MGFNSGTLLTGTLSDFGFNSGDPLEFIFDVTGGDASSLFGSLVGVILSSTGFKGDFDGNFNNLVLGFIPDSGSGVADTGPQPVPEPATMLLLGIGLVGLAGAARRKFTK